MQHWESRRWTVDIEHEIAFSDETRRRQTIAAWYNLYLGRSATAAEITSWHEEVAKRIKTMEDVERSIALSQEAHDAQRPPPPEMRGPQLAELLKKPRREMSWADRVALNERARTLLLSDVPQSEEDALAHALHQAGIYDGSITDQELPPPARPTVRRNEMASTQNLDAGASIRGQLNTSARELRDAMIEAALRTRNPALRSAGAALSIPPSFDPRAAFTKSLAATSGSGSAKGQMKRLGELLRARGMADDPISLPLTILASTAVLVWGKLGESNADRRAEVDYLRKAGLLAPVPAAVKAQRFYVDRLGVATSEQFEAQRNLDNAQLRLRNVGQHDKPRWEAAYHAVQDAKFALERAQLKVADRKKELDAANAELQKLRLEPRDWEGMWPEDIDARKRREELLSQPHLFQGFMSK